MDCSHTSPYQPVLAVFSEPSQRWILQYLDLLTTRRYAPATLTAIVKTLVGLLRYLPQERQGRLAAAITQTTAQDISAFLSAGLRAGLAPSTLNTKLSILASFFAYLCDAGVMQQQPVSRRQHRLFTPEVLPKVRLVVHQRFDQRALCSPTLKFDNLLGVNFFFQPKGRRAALLPTLRVLLAVSQTISHEITWLVCDAHPVYAGLFFHDSYGAGKQCVACVLTDLG